MKKQILLAAVAFFLTIGTIFAQAPEQFNYQGVARTAAGQPIASQAITLQLSILTGSATGTAQYVETHSATTNAYGLYNVAIGGGTVVSGTMAGVTWGSATKFLKVEMDPAGGTAYVTLGTNQLLSAPYALNSKSSENVSGTIGNLAKFTGANTVGNSLISEDLSPTVPAINIGSPTTGVIPIFHMNATQGYAAFFEGSNNRGYFGSYGGAPQDVDFGTGGLNSAGAVHLSLQGVPKFTLGSNSFIGIGTTAPATDMEILQPSTGFTTSGLRYSWTGNSNFWTTSFSGLYYSFAYNGARVSYVDNSSGAYVTTSDARLKKNIKPMGSVLDRLNQMNVVEYQYKRQNDDKEDENISLGLLAQEVKPLFPELVRYQEDGDTMGLNYAEFGVLAIKAIQEQQKLIEKLEARIAELEKK